MRCIINPAPCVRTWVLYAISSTAHISAHLESLVDHDVSRLSSHVRYGRCDLTNDTCKHIVFRIGPGCIRSGFVGVDRVEETGLFCQLKILVSNVSYGGKPRSGLGPFENIVVACPWPVTPPLRQIWVPLKSLPKGLGMNRWLIWSVDIQTP